MNGHIFEINTLIIKSNEEIANWIILQKSKLNYDANKEIHPILIEFKNMIKSNPTFETALNKMIKEVTWWFKYSHPTKCNDAYIKNSEEMFSLMNLVIKANCNTENYINVLLYWCKNTPTGDEFFKNGIIKKHIDMINNI